MNITVYCGASIGTEKIYQERTKELGKWIAEKADALVYGGGNVGLMGIVADTVLAHNGKVIGVMPTFLMEREIGHHHLTEMIIVDSMTERKKKMIELGDVYIALPGGLGTLEEISEVISWARVGINNKPCIFFTIDNYYEHLEKHFEYMVEKGFLSKDYKNKVLFTDSIDEIEGFINEYK